MEVQKAFGPHLTIDLSGCDFNILSDVELHKNFLKNLPSLINMTPIIEPQVLYYAGGDSPEDSGPTGFIVIATSHISIHSFEHKGKCFIDIFSCMPFDTKKTLDYIKKIFKPKNLKKNLVQRGKDFPRNENFYTKKNGEKVINLIGNTYGKLKVISRAPNRQGKKNSLVQWFCLCECGHVIAVDGSELKKGSIKSCGCLRKEVKRSLAGQAVLNNIFRNYKTGAKDRNLDFNLTLEDFKKLIFKNCWYCGIEPSNSASLKGKDVTKEWLHLPENNFKYNGIDRVDNTLGYLPENCVPCCHMCNNTKRDMPLNTFLSWLKRIHENLNQNETYLNIDKNNQEIFNYYKRYKK